MQHKYQLVLVVPTDSHVTQNQHFDWLLCETVLQSKRLSFKLQAAFQLIDIHKFVIDLSLPYIITW